jgi:hypothetical protein
MTTDDKFLVTLRELCQEKIKECDLDTKTALRKNDDGMYWAAQGRKLAYKHVLSLIPVNL